MAERQIPLRRSRLARKQLSLRERITTSSRSGYSRSNEFIKRRPLGSFLVVLSLLLLLLIAGKLLQKPPEEKVDQKITKTINVYSIGEGPKAAFQAKVEKTGVVQIVAQMGGIVQDIPVKEGQTINKGQLVVSLASNYQGGNAASVQREIAKKQYQLAKDTLGPQLELIQKQKDVATASADQAQQTRDIARQSLGETSDLINANQSQLDQMREQLTALQAATPPGTTSPQVAELQGAISQMQGGINQLRQAQRTTEFQASNEKSPALLANLQKDIALKQLEVQEKTVQLNKEVSHLQVRLAYVNESIMFPSSPFAGKVEKIAVRKGQSVAPGTVLATIASDEIETSAVLLVPQNIAQVISLGEPSSISIGTTSASLTPYYVSSQATDGQLYSVFYDIPKDVQNTVSDGDYITINVPLGSAKTTAAVPLIPIDAVYQNQDSAFVLVAKNNKAQTRTVTTGSVFGSYVEVKNGLQNGDQIITNRNVIAEDQIKISNF